MAMPSPFRWRIFRCPLADYCQELEAVEKAYAPEALEKIRAEGYNAVWLRVVLREGVELFPGLAPQAGALEALREIVRRCGAAGLRVFVYLNEPLGFPEDDPFWEAYPQLRGEPGRSFDDGWDHANALCTSQPETLLAIRRGVAALFTAVPDLAGVIAITASEHLTHCYAHASRYRKVKEQGGEFRLNCPLCRERSPASVVGEILGAMRAGLDDAGGSGELIAWNWSWSYYEAAPQAGMIASLPERVTLMIDFERGGSQWLPEVEKRIDVDEYSLGYAGPSESFTAIAQAAAGRPVMAKLQIGTTHEMATVPNLPLIPHLYRKLRALAEAGGVGFLACWCLGTFPGLNSFAVGWLAENLESGEAEAEALRRLAAVYFPGCDEEAVVRAWEQFSDAFSHFPQSQDFLYIGPVNAAPAYPWGVDEVLTPMRPSWFPPTPFGNDFDRCVAPLTLEEMLLTLGCLLEKWWAGVAVYRAALERVANPNAAVEAGVARMIGHQFESTRNLFAFEKARRDGDRGEMLALIHREVAQLEEAIPLMEADARLGWHQGCFPRQQSFYDALSVAEKIGGLRDLEKRLAAEPVG